MLLDAHDPVDAIRRRACASRWFVAGKSSPRRRCSDPRSPCPDAPPKSRSP